MKILLLTLTLLLSTASTTTQQPNTAIAWVNMYETGNYIRYEAAWNPDIFKNEIEYLDVLQEYINVRRNKLGIKRL